MKLFTDPILIVLLGLMFATLAAYFMGVFVYPFGLLVLAIFIVARILYLTTTGGSRRS